MPTFVIHALGQPSRKVTVAKAPVRVGRDAVNEIVLGDDTVSRQHAIFGVDATRRWYVGCVSETNAIVVDGKMVTKRKYVTDGTEIFIGRQHLVIFAVTERAAAGYLGQAGAFVKGACPKCDWKGMIRGTSRELACPDCGSLEVRADNVYAKEHELERAKEGATSLMSPAHVATLLGKLRSAKRSWVERTDGRDEVPQSLAEDRTLEISRKEPAGLHLFGLTFGGAVHIAWDGAQYVATSTIVFPGMKVNGVVKKSSPLKHDDEIQIGSNRFRFATG